MPIKTAGGLEKVSLVLTENQVSVLREILDDRRKEASFRRISLSDVAREVVAAGLEVVTIGPSTDIHTTAGPLSTPEAA